MKKTNISVRRFGGEYIVPQATVNMVSGTRKGTAALATFTFNYRPFGASRALYTITGA